MKKTILTILLCGVMVLSITGCGTNKNEFDIGNESDIVVSGQDVSLTIKEGTLKNTGVTLVLKNSSNKLLRYDEVYEIEIKKDDKWHKINVELNFTLPSFDLKANETKEIDLKWADGYGKLAKGTYRIIKGIDYEYEEGKYQSFNVAVEFNID